MDFNDHTIIKIMAPARRTGRANLTEQQNKKKLPLKMQIQFPTAAEFTEQFPLLLHGAVVEMKLMSSYLFEFKPKGCRFKSRVRI